MHVVAGDENKNIKAEIREELEEHGISHVTIEVESEDEECKDTKCHIKENITYGYGNKYKMIGLSKNGIEEMKPVHYWIMITFSPNPNPDIYDEINHKDENPSNNKLDNLEWCSKSYNKRYGTRIRRVLDTFKKVNSPKQEKPVLQYTKDNVFIAEYVSISEAARKTNSSFKHISDCCLGKRKTHNGYVWKIKEVA